MDYIELLYAAEIRKIANEIIENGMPPNTINLEQRRAYRQAHFPEAIQQAALELQAIARMAKLKK